MVTMVIYLRLRRRGMGKVRNSGVWGRSPQILNLATKES